MKGFIVSTSCKAVFYACLREVVSKALFDWDLMNLLSFALPGRDLSHFEISRNVYLQ